MKLSYINALGIYLAFLFVCTVFIPGLTMLPERALLIAAFGPVFGLQLAYLPA